MTLLAAGVGLLFGMVGLIATFARWIDGRRRLQDCIDLALFAGVCVWCSLVIYAAFW